ncbi:hypothetical protein U3516DRAFT_591816, partial [Neocallimastix sp. 'constans']
MKPKVDELRNIRDSYYKDNVYKRNKRTNNERPEIDDYEKKHDNSTRSNNNYNYENKDSSNTNSKEDYYDDKNYEKINSSNNYRNYNKPYTRIYLNKEILLCIKKFFAKKQNIILTLVFINVIVYLSWEFALYYKKEFHNNKLLNFMRNHFLISWKNLVTRKRYWTLVTSMFSHKNIVHLSSNMITFLSFAPPVLKRIKTKKFIIAYLFAGISSSYAHAIFYHSVVPKLSKNVSGSILYNLLFLKASKKTYDSIAGLGASGAITGINTIFACLYPSKLLKYKNRLRLPAWLTMSLYIIGDFHRSMTRTNGHIDTIAHVGGGIAGYIYY